MSKELRLNKIDEENSKAKTAGEKSGGYAKSEGGRRERETKRKEMRENRLARDWCKRL